MNRQIALAYGIAGLSLAVALVMMIGSTAGLVGGAPQGAATTTVAAPPAAPATPPLAPAAISLPAPAAAATWDGGLFSADAVGPDEVVYVNEPARDRRQHDDDDDDDDDDHHHRGRRDHDDHDDHDD